MLACRLRTVGLRDASLEITNDPAQDPRREEPPPKRAGPILADRREQSQDGSGRRGHVIKLPADLVGHSICPVRARPGQPPPQRMRRPPGRARPCGGRRRPARPLERPQQQRDRSPREPHHRSWIGGGFPRRCRAHRERSPRPDDRIARAAVLRSLRLEHSQHPPRAVRRPRRDDPPAWLSVCGEPTPASFHAPSAAARLPTPPRNERSANLLLSSDRHPDAAGRSRSARRGRASRRVSIPACRPRRKRRLSWVA